MMKYLILTLTLVSLTANAQVPSDGDVIYHSLTPDSGPQIGDTPPVPKFSWDRPTWSQGGISMNTGGAGGGGFGGAGSSSAHGIIDKWDLE